MNEPKKEKVIDLLRKLFALGQSPNQHEAEAAMAKANAIMTEYQINATDIDLADDGEVTREEMELEGGAQSTWLCNLGQAAAKLYDAKCYYMRGGRNGNMVLRFYGTPADILAAKMTFNHLYASWQSIVKLDLLQNRYEVPTKTFKRSHAIGFAHALNDRVDELVKERQVKVKSTTGRDLVVVKGALIDDFMKGIKVKVNRASSNISPSAYQSSTERGRNIPLHGVLGGEEKPLQITGRRA